MQTKLWPSEAWRAAFREGATPGTLRAARRCAEIEIARLQRVDVPVPWEAEDLVHKILVRTCSGSLRWDPDNVSLRAHLYDKVRMACRRKRRRWQEHHQRMVELDAAGDEAPVLASDGLHTPSPEAEVALAELARRVEAEVWEKIKADPIATKVFGAMIEHDGGNKELVEATGLPIDAIRSAKKRIRRIAAHLSRELIAALGRPRATGVQKPASRRPGADGGADEDAARSSDWS